jgi:hypothetical protein
MMIKMKPSDENSIRIDEAKKLIQNFQTRHPEKCGSFFFGEDIIVRIIGHNDAVGFKIFMGCTEHHTMQLIMVGTREDGSEIWPIEEDPSKKNQIGIGIPCT